MNLRVLLVVFVVVCSLRASVRSDNIFPPYHLLQMKVGVYILPILKFDFDSLEPYLDEATMDVHYNGHHEAYRRKMSAAIKEWRMEEPDNDLAHDSILEIMRNLKKVPEKYRKALTNNGGGYVNHCIYWGCLNLYDKITERQPTARLMKEIEKQYESFENFKQKFSEMALEVFGSGYVWLSRQPSKDGGGLLMHTTANQDSPVSDGLYPILVLDVWEHAYYLQHQHRRVDYIKQWWNVVDWANIDALDAWWQNLYEKKKDEL